MRVHIYAGALLAVLAGPALANPIAVAGAQAVAGSVAESNSFAGAESTGVGVGGGATSSSGSNSTKNETTGYAVGLSQAPTAVSGVCGKGNKFAFGALEWTDFSSKCFNYMIALEAAKRGEWELANQWVVRADGM